MLPVWLSDLRGAVLVWAALAAANCAGLRTPILLALLTLVCAVGFATSVAFYVHVTRTVFNRRVTLNPLTYWRVLMLTRPLEIAWRFLTAPLRVLPDFQILGEVRTGTTTLAALLRSLGCEGPFSPWIVPLASDKESFYFAGHYWGVVHPAAYRMCFPLKPTMWLWQVLRGHRPPVFDACASHLNAPWAAPLLRRATPEAALVVLLRPPAQQNVSWWRLEMGAHQWGKSMGMGEDFIPENYPPRTFEDALALSRSERVEELYREGELAAGPVLAAGVLEGLTAARLPERLLPHPSGQLAALDRMGRYADNISRYVKHFGKEQLHFLETSELSQADSVKGLLEAVGAQVPALGKLLATHFDLKVALSTGGKQQLNASAPLPPELEPERKANHQAAS